MRNFLSVKGVNVCWAKGKKEDKKKTKQNRSILARIGLRERERERERVRDSEQKRNNRKEKQFVGETKGQTHIKRETNLIKGSRAVCGRAGSPCCAAEQAGDAPPSSSLWNRSSSSSSSPQ